MNKFIVNKTNGFLESPNSFSAFGADKKVRFLEIAWKFLSERKEIPDISEICDVIGISRRSFERHINADESFKSQWRELLLRAEDILVNIMFQRGKTPGGYMDRITWLRRNFPEHWNPEYKVTQEFNHTINSQLIEKAKAYEIELFNTPDDDSSEPPNK